VTRKSALVAILIVLSAVFAFTAEAQPPAPTVVAPAAGAALIQPITLSWNAVVDPAGPIGSYTWEVSNTSTFGVIIASGFTNATGDPNIPTRTQDRVSGLPNGTYFWRVKATQIVGGAVFAIDSPFSPVRTFTVVGLGPAPGTPSFTSPASPAQFHVREFFLINWTDVPGAHHYLLEADDQPNFSYPLTLTTDPMKFGTSFRAGWGNPLNVFYRIVAVSADGVRSLPSPTLAVTITNAAPVPPPPVPLSPIGGATVTLPFTLDWTDTANPLVAAYDVDIDNDPNFAGAIGVLFVQGVSRSDYMVVPDPQVQGFNIFPPGTYFWRVRAVHGDVLGPWSAGQSFTVAPLPPTPPGLAVFHIINEPGSVEGGNSTQARVTLNMPAPPGGALVSLATDMPHAQVPTSVVVPAGKTDATVTPVTTIPVPGATIGSVRAAYGLGWQDNSLGLFPLLWGIALDHDTVVGGSPVLGTATLLNPAPPGGVEVALVNGDNSVMTLPATVFIPAGGTGATFDVLTAPVSVATHVTIDAGTAFEGYRSPGAGLTVVPPGSPPTAPSIASLTLASAKILGGVSTTGTVTLTAPAPAGGAAVSVCGSMQGQVVTPSCFPPSVIVPAGSLSADFPITAPQVNSPSYVLIQASYGPTGAMQAKLLEIDPGPPGASVLFAFGISSTIGVIGGTSMSGTVSTVMLAPAGGGAVTMTSSNPSIVQVPATVPIPAGNSAASFTITTNPVLVGATVQVDATAGGVTRSQFINLGPDPNAAPLLSSVTLASASVTGGSSVSGTVFLSSPAPTGGVTVTIATSNLVAQPQPIATVLAGQSSASFTVTTSAVTANTPVTITASFGATARSASLTVLAGAAPPPPPPPSGTPGTPSLLSPATDATVAQPILFDWSDTANSASYRIQISSSNNFSPITFSQTVSVSQATVSGLPAQRLFWRVQGISSTGVAGPFSAARRFTAQAGAPPPPPPASLSSVSVTPTSVVGGNSSQGTVTLTAGAPAGGAVVGLSSANTAAATVPASVTVAAGATSATFTVTTTSVTASTALSITGTFNAVSRSAVLTVNPPPPPASLSSVTVSPTSVVGGAASTGTATLTSAAPTGGAIVTLSSSTTTVASVPASVTVAAGALSANFSITTTAVTVATPVTISGTFGGASRTAVLTVNPPPPPASLSSVTVSPTSVVGGAASTGTVTLTTVAPTGGAIVTLSSSTTTVASVPASVTVTAGALSANFSITTTAVTAATPVTIGGAFGGASRTATLTVNPPAPPPPPAQSATLTVTATGRTGERVTSSPAGINVTVGSTGSATFTTGTSITLSASNTRDVIWSGACSSGGNKAKTCTFTLTGAASVSANVQ